MNSSTVHDCRRSPMKSTKTASDSKRSQSTRGSQKEEETDEGSLVKMKTLLESIHNKVRLVKLRQYDTNSKLGFSLRGGKESTGSSVGVFVSHVEQRSEADKKGLKIGDQLMQVNGLNVNQATYDEVIGLIKQTPRSHDILLRVTNFGKIPVQEKPGDSISWLPVLELLEAEPVKGSNRQHKSTKNVAQVEPEVTERPKLMEPNPKAFSLSSDEGIESCESQRAHSLSSESDEADTCSPAKTYLPARQQSAAHDAGSHDDSALSSTLTLSNDDECCSCSSVCSISSASASVASSEQVASSNLSAEDKHIRVPGGQRSSEPFGCGVVKGPDEWPGIFVQNVRPGSLAERVGLQPGDQLLEADGQVLAELTFDVAIGLIKRLQQQQEELLLLVRKGAALKHLASSRLQQNQQAAAAAAVQQQQQQHRLKSTQPTSSERRRKEAIAVPGSRSLQNQQVVKSETAESTTTATAITTTTTTTSTAALTSTNCSLEASRVSSSGDLISDTQNHSSAKLTSPQQQQQQRKVACDVNMEMRKWSSKLKSAQEQHQEQQVVASQVDRGRRLSEQRQHLKAPVADRQEQQAQEEEQRQCSSPSPQHQRQQPQQRTAASSQWQFRRQQVAERPEETSSAPVEQQPPTGALKNQRAEAVAATKIAVPRGCIDNKVNCQANKMRYREEADEEDEEIRIVSQNCKLYHHQSGVAHHSFKSSSILHEKFPHLASSRHHQQVQVPQQQRAGQTPAQRKMQPPAPSARRRQTVDDMRRQLDSRTRQPATGQLQRYVSMDNLWIGQRQQQQAHQQVVRPQPRGVSACRFEPASDHGYSRPEVPSSAVMSSRQQRLYRRSNSVMGQSALGACCLPAGSGSGELNMECGQRTCCLQQVRQPPRCMSAARKYNNTIGAPLALSRAKARSMDKLNMNISLNYVNIGMNHYQALARNHLPQVNAPSDCASGGSPKQLRPIGGHHHHLPVCCMSAAAANPTLPNIYNYATAARMISSGTQSSPRLTSHQRLPSTASSTATTCCEQAVRERRQVTCQLVASPAKRAVSQTRAATTCCEPPPSTATIYAQSMIPHKSPRDQCSAKTAYTLSGSRVAAPSYTCCSLICCPQSAAESLVCAHNNLQVAGTKPREHLVSRSRKYDVNHVTDSSTDSSRYTISSVVGSRHRQPRLLKVCKAPQPPPPPPPPPVEAGNKCRAPCLIGQRDTRQHLTTFLATPSLGRQVNSSDVSPTCSSYSVTSSSPSSTSSASSSSASSTSTGSTTSANDLSMSDGRSVSPPTTCRPVLVGRQQKRAPAPAAPEAQHHIPRPPPPPGQDLDFERKMGKLVEQANNVQLASGVVGQSKPEVSKANRLCFVDELKMLAKRQQQQQQQQSGQVTKTGHPTQVTSALDSSTLIKIINASKPSAGCKSCSCQSGVGQRQSNATEPDTCAAAKCSRSGNRSSESKSVKLSDEDNKRRQHEMLMKEFKSAHSRMFKQRAAKLEEEISGSRDNNNNHHQQVNCDVVEKPAKRTGIKSLAVTSANGGLLPIHAVI